MTGCLIWLFDLFLCKANWQTLHCKNMKVKRQWWNLQQWHWLELWGRWSGHGQSRGSTAVWMNPLLENLTHQPTHHRAPGADLIRQPAAFLKWLYPCHTTANGGRTQCSYLQFVSQLSFTGRIRVQFNWSLGVMRKDDSRKEDGAGCLTCLPGHSGMPRQKYLLIKKINKSWLEIHWDSMLKSRKNTETELLGIRLLIPTDLKHRWKFGPKTWQGMSVFLLHSGSHRAAGKKTYSCRLYKKILQLPFRLICTSSDWGRWWRSSCRRRDTMQTPHLEGPAGNLTCSHCASYRQTFSYSFLGVGESYLV